MWKNNRIYLASALLGASLLLGCNGGTPDKPNNGNGGSVTNEPFKPVAPDMNADSMFSFVEKQLSFGPRIPGTPAHKACADWMVEKFKAYGATTVLQTGTFRTKDGQSHNIKNVIASYLPQNPARRILVTAHWDTRPMADKDGKSPNAPVPGANDGGSGVAVILEIARQFSLKAPSVGVDLILWDAEDNGNYNDNESWCLGSQYWTKNQHVPNYRASYGINLDMVGAKDAKFSKDMYSVTNAPIETDKVWNMAHKLGYGMFFPLGNKDFASIDDHYFVMQGASIPMVEIIDRNTSSGEFFPHWHTTTDDLSQIDKNSLKAVGQTVLEVLYREK